MSEVLRLDALLEILTRHRVDFIVVGGVAAILQGSPLTTGDLDVLYGSSPENHSRLMAALTELGAEYLDPAGRRLLPSVERLQALRMHLLKTSQGRLDLLQEIGTGLSYENLVDRTLWFQVAGHPVRVLELGAVIESKEQADRPKDRFQIPFLRQLLAELQRRQSETEQD